MAHSVTPISNTPYPVQPLLAAASDSPRPENDVSIPPMTRLTKKPLAEMPQRLTTPRLILREICLSDAEQYSLLASDSDIARMTMSFPHPFPALSAEFFIMRFMARRREGRAYPYAITTQSSDDLIGMMDIFRNADNHWEIGYWVGRPSWGQGFATEAGAAIIDMAQSVLEVTEMHAAVFADNPASLRVLGKLGFVETGETNTAFSMARRSKAPGIELIRTSAS